MLDLDSGALERHVAEDDGLLGCVERRLARLWKSRVEGCDVSINPRVGRVHYRLHIGLRDSPVAKAATEVGVDRGTLLGG